jgi:hypothetical protein
VLPTHKAGAWAAMATQKETAMTNIPKPTLTLDMELYQHYLDDSDLSDAEKAELLETLWSIICEFVRLGFGVHPVQQVTQEPCGKLEIPTLNATQTDSSALDSTYKSVISTFIDGEYKNHKKGEHSNA